MLQNARNLESPNLSWEINTLSPDALFNLVEEIKGEHRVLRISESSAMMTGS